jgi:ABC-type polysaccharide/polyol phosphate export permease
MFRELNAAVSRFGGQVESTWRRPRRPVAAPFFRTIDNLFILRAIILRDLTLKYQKAGRLGLLTEFVMPTMIIVLHYYVFLVLQRYMPAGIPVELYVLGGFTTWFTFRNCASKRTRPTEAGYGVILMPGISQMHFLLATAAWECTAMVFMLFAGLLLAEAFGGDEPLPHLLSMVAPYVIAAAMGTGFKLVFDSLGALWPFIKGIKKAILFLIFLTSGIYYTGQTSSMDLLAQISWYNPLFDLLMTEREALWAGYPLVGVSLIYSLAWTAILLFAGLMLHRRIRPWLYK